MVRFEWVILLVSVFSGVLIVVFSVLCGKFSGCNRVGFLNRFIIVFFILILYVLFLIMLFMCMFSFWMICVVLVGLMCFEGLVEGVVMGLLKVVSNV